MNKLILGLLLTLFSSPLFAQWTIETFEHSATGKQSQSAMVRNEEGFELAIFQTSEGTIWLDFSLSDNTFDELSQNELPQFQIDDYKPVQMIRGFVATIVPADEGISAVVVSDSETISTKRDFSVNHIVAERLPERIICPIWQGKSRPHLGTVEQITTGNFINFSYVLLDGTKGKTRFSLQGAKQAVNTLISQ